MQIWLSIDIIDFIIEFCNEYLRWLFVLWIANLMFCSSSATLLEQLWFLFSCQASKFGYQHIILNTSSQRIAAMDQMKNFVDSANFSGR